jgi:hypothetical protein
MWQITDRVSPQVRDLIESDKAAEVAIAVFHATPAANRSAPAFVHISRPTAKAVKSMRRDYGVHHVIVHKHASTRPFGSLWPGET